MTARAKICLLTFFFAICGTGAVVTAYVQVWADRNVKPEELYAVVDRQLGELRGGNYNRAYEYASTDIQRRFNVEQFAAMIQAQYPGMTQACRAQYGLAELNGRHATIQVYLIGGDGSVIPCVYTLVHEGESWRIDGTRILQAWPPDLRMEGTML